MPRVVKYGKPRATRFFIDTDEALVKFCAENKVNISDVMQQSVECFIKNPNCEARANFTRKKVR